MQNCRYSFNLGIADYTIRLLSDSEIKLEEGYLPFVIPESIQVPDFTIECLTEINTAQFEAGDLVFEAKNDKQRFYSIYSIGSELGFVVYNQQKEDEIQQVALLDRTFTHWKVWSEIIENAIIPLKYPLGPIIMHYITLKTSAVMMHASAAFDGNNARLFTGFSGVGKSTISRLMADAGNQIINDDRIIIRNIDSSYFVYNTPMYYADKPKKALLKSVFLISHSPENKIKKLSGATAISKVMAFCIQNNFDKQFIQNRLTFFGELCKTVSIFELGFVPNEQVVHFIKEHDV